jgi:hypothetical protein
VKERGEIITAIGKEKRETDRQTDRQTEKGIDGKSERGENARDEIEHE